MKNISRIPLLRHGYIEVAVSQNLILNVEKLLAVIDEVVANRETGARLRGFRVNPNALINFKAFAANLYHLPEGTTDKGRDFHHKYHHIFVAGVRGNDKAMDEMLDKKYDVFQGEAPYSLSDLVGNWIPTKAVCSLHK